MSWKAIAEDMREKHEAQFKAIQAAAPKDILDEIGFDFESFIEVDVKVALCPASEIVGFYNEVSVRSRGLLDAQPTDKRDAVEEALISSYQQFEVDGIVQLPMPHRIITATKPT